MNSEQIIIVFVFVKAICLTFEFRHEQKTSLHTKQSLNETKEVMQFAF